MHDFLSTMCHLQINPELLSKIRHGYMTDPAYSGPRIPTGVTFDNIDNTGWRIKYAFQPPTKH